jgi:hypothetical protein
MNRRWVVVMVDRSGAIEVYGIFNNRSKAFDEMERRRIEQPHRYVATKLTQIRSAGSAAPERAPRFE